MEKLIRIEVDKDGKLDQRDYERQLGNLKKLELWMEEIPKMESMDKLRNLQELNLSGNIIQKMEGMNKLVNLKELFLHSNRIHKMGGMDHLINLQALHLYYNKVQKMEGLGMLVNLQELHLNFNRIQKMEGMEKLVNLRELDLKNNKIQKMEGMEQLVNLQKLNLLGNEIRKMEGMSKLVSLQELVLSCNKIQRMEGMESLVVMRVLLLSRNSELKVIENLLPLLKLEKVTLSGCPILVILDLDKAKKSIIEGVDWGRVKVLSELEWLKGEIAKVEKMMKEKEKVLEREAMEEAFRKERNRSKWVELRKEGERLVKERNHSELKRVLGKMKKAVDNWKTLEGQKAEDQKAFQLLLSNTQAVFSKKTDLLVQNKNRELYGKDVLLKIWKRRIAITVEKEREIERMIDMSKKKDKEIRKLQLELKKARRSFKVELQKKDEIINRRGDGLSFLVSELYPKWMKSKPTLVLLEKVERILGDNVLSRNSVLNILFDVMEKKVSIEKALSVWLKGKESWGAFFRIALDSGLEFRGDPWKGGEISVWRRKKALFGLGSPRLTLVFKGFWENGVLIRKTEFDLKNLFEKDLSSLDLLKSLRNSENILGGGASADVFKILFEKKAMAYKKMKSDFVKDQRSVKKFTHLLKLLFSLYHPNIVSFYGYSLAENDMGLLMELGRISVHNLVHKCLRKNIRIPFSTKLKVLLGVAKAVEYLHHPKVSVIHRDLKWDNVVVANSGFVKLIDFGVIKEPVGLKETKTGSIIGTDWFVAPEVVIVDDNNKARYNHKVDQFSFSIMMYTLLFDVCFGKPHFELDVLFYRKGAEGAPLITRPSLRPTMKGKKFKGNIGKKSPFSVQQWIVDLMKKCWDADPKKRPEFSQIVKILREKYDVIGSSGDDLNLLIDKLEKK